MADVAELVTARQKARLSTLLPGLYAWAVTVALPASAAHAPWWARLPAGVACAALLASPVAGRRHPLFGVVLGVHVFVGASLLCWIALHTAGLPLAAHALTATFGGFGWMLFAFGWGDLRARRIPESDPHVLAGPPLVARHSFPRSAEWVLALGTLGSGCLLFLAWRVDRPSHAVLAQASALLASLLVVAASARVALERVPRELPSSSERYGGAASALALLVLALGLGVIFWMLER
ncbi:MAG: hypothetical protein QM756_22065 [Polyangiaceae bacterium]